MINEIKTDIKMSIYEHDLTSLDSNLDRLLSFANEKNIDTDTSLLVNQISVMLYALDTTDEYDEQVLSKVIAKLGIAYNLLSFHKKMKILKKKIAVKGEASCFEEIKELATFNAPFDLKHQWLNLFINAIWIDKDRLVQYSSELAVAIAELKQGTANE